MLVSDLMQNEVVIVHEDDKVADLLDYLIRERFHGAPVLDSKDKLVGVVTQQDIFFSQMTQSNKVGGKKSEYSGEIRVKEIMTSPAVTVTEDTEVKALCELMAKLRIHRVPVLRKGQVAGLVSSLDVCDAIARGELEI